MSKQVRCPSLMFIFSQHTDNVSTKHLISVAAPYVRRSPVVERWKALFRVPGDFLEDREARVTCESLGRVHRHRAHAGWSS
jgi:hypothetical protein